uniref:Uncharacterized protein n=1 Tax=uncultured Desulfobacterium sp. TaxID=201089 RepID=E1YKC7_9BACT|nr:unknown protein [uncultured Desulfobacterium sp.]CBX30761.1 unknown protein [uncultured Desulfobacterium sp.]
MNSIILFGVQPPNPRGLAHCRPKYDIKAKGRTKMRPPYFGHPFGARVAPQRCPILRKDENKISERIYYARYLFKINRLR